MTLEEFEALKKIASEETKVTVDNVQLMTLKIPNLQMKYLDLYSKEKARLKTYEQDYDKILAVKFEHYRFNGDYKISTKAEADRFVLGDTDVYNKRMLVEGQAIVVEYLHGVLNHLGKMGFSIGHYLEFIKLKNGILS
jgi:Recombination, repair and ssDNA binding protein UvsY